MNPSVQRRHSRWYERILFNYFFLFLLGYSLVVWLPAWLQWPHRLLHWPLSSTSLNTLLASSIGFITSTLVLRKLKHYPGTQSLLFVLPAQLTLWLLVFAVFLFIRQPAYSRSVLGASFVLALGWGFIGELLRRRFRTTKLAAVPYGRAQELKQLNHPATITWLSHPSLEGRRFDGVVADLRARELREGWEPFLAQCTLSGIPVYNSRQIVESLTGRVKVTHLSENIFGALLPSGMYSAIKRTGEALIILALSPLWLPIMLIIGLAIKLESRGPMFFVQKRVGQGNKDFKVYKLRSMRLNAEAHGAQFAQKNDRRVTRVGKFIRQTRLDEIPQFINILKGDMSLIGPRPEQRQFVDQFSQAIPFYAYRHVVKPGITGWAQVMHGYAADAEDTQIKIEHDFYYIKHFSLWLDMLIVIKTIKTVLTGFGSR